MRIVAGKFKGMTLLGPKDKKIRPLKDMVRESIFNFLIFFSKILMASFSFSTKTTFAACLEMHSSPNDPVPEYKSKTSDCSSENEILLE